jgi:TonB family protein
MRAAQQADPCTDLQTKYHNALQEMKRLQHELDQARRDIAHLQQQLKHVGVSKSLEWLTAGNAYFVQKKYQDAIEAFTIGIGTETTPHEAKLYRNRGMAYAQLGNTAQAIQDFTLAIARDPQDAVAYNQRGIAYYQLDNAQQALEDFSKAIEHNPKLGETYNNRGIVSRRLGNYAQAIQDFRLAAQLGLELASHHLQVLHEEVRQLQESLRLAGFNPGPADGLPGPQTTAALRAYQRSQGFPATGWLDDTTKQAIGRPSARPTASPPPGSEMSPRFVHQPKPDYPLLARQQGWEGTVTLQLELLADGTIGEVEIAMSSGYPLLDTAAREAAKTWTHEPAAHQGVPGTREVTLQVHFALDKDAATDR